MILDIDLGNSRLKWRLIDDSATIYSGVESGLLQEMLHQLANEIGDIYVKRVRLVHVLGNNFEVEILAFFKKKFNLLVEVAKSTSRCDDVVNQYQPPEQLGVDRWLAALTAFNAAKDSCCVIDCGSAITVDFVLNTGAYVGGYIAPGLKMLSFVLSQNTKQLPFIKVYGSSPLSIGQSTSQAITGGILVMVVSFIERAVGDFFSGKSELKAVFLTGGDAETIAKHLKFDSSVRIILAPNLVIDGLSIALP